jgi:cell division protein FtsQ
LDHQSIKRKKAHPALLSRRVLGQLGFSLVKVFLFVVALGVLSFALISGYQFLSASSYFRIQDIVVEGVSEALRGELIRISGIRERESFFSINPVAIKRNMEEHPWIKSVFLEKKFPHTLYIRADKAEPVATVVLEKLYLLDSEGVVFKEVEQGDSIDFPVITGLASSGRENRECLMRVASFLEALGSSSSPVSVRELSEVHVEEDGGLTVYINKLPCRIFFGRDDFIRKIGALTRIIRHLKSAHRLYQAQSIDLGYGDRAVVAFRDSVV